MGAPATMTISSVPASSTVMMAANATLSRTPAIATPDSRTSITTRLNGSGNPEKLSAKRANAKAITALDVIATAITP